MSKQYDEHRLTIDDYEVGFIKINGCDNFVVIGSFRPGPDYDRLEPIFAAMQGAHAAMDLDDDSEAPETLIEHLDELNERKMFITRSSGDSQQIRDFHIDDNNRVEFKFS